MLALIPPWVMLAALGLLTSLLGVQTVRLSWVEAEFATYKADVAENTRKAEVKARAKEKSMRDSADKVANEQAQKQADLEARATHADAVADGLRNEIERLNASAAPSDPAAAALAGQARTARKLLGACANEYRAMAKHADELRDQVSGLQGYATTVCKN